MVTSHGTHLLGPLLSCFYFKWLSCSVSGKDPDVGEVMVKSLQNTKYSVDEKLENSFITLFGKKHDILLRAQSCQEYAHKFINQTNDEETDDSDEESDAEELDGSEISDEDNLPGDPTTKILDSDSDEENNDALEEQCPSKNNLTEHIEFHDGRMRRKAFFGDDSDHDHLKVTNTFFFLKNRL